MPASFRTSLHPLIRQLADSIEAIWQDNLTLSPYQVPTDLGYIEGSLEGSKLVIENQCHQTPQFRKLHLELAQVGNGIDILHCVMFPEPTYGLPIFGVDLVGSQRAGITAAIADLSPANGVRSLPLQYREALAQLPEVEFSQPRALPQWADIFSKFCLFIRPQTVEEETAFLQRAQNYLTIHCQLAVKAQQLGSTLEVEETIAAQKYYCAKQQQNDKTRRVLEKSFGPEWTERYMSTMLFDIPVSSS
ncbi:MAG: phycocyanobilin:ferredoxin oxidoreductase [Cyanobacteria bacterium P01_H01_bin.15]